MYAKLSTAKSANRQCKKLAHTQTPLHASAKNPFINPEKNFYGCQQSAHKYYSLIWLALGLGLVIGLLCRLGLVLRSGSSRCYSVRTANSLRMHYIAVCMDCNVVHPDAICSPCLVFIQYTYSILSFFLSAMPPKDLVPFSYIYTPHKKTLF